MNDKKDFKKALLEQNGLQPGNLPDLRRKEIEMMLERTHKRIRRMRRITLSVWGLLAFLCISMVVWRLLSPPDSDLPEWVAGIMFIGTYLLFLIAIIFSISFCIRWVSATARELNARLELITEKLDSLAGKE